ncbi:CfaE/CblD family pilus tip adhesin, partial [Shigella flexneri]
SREYLLLSGNSSFVSINIDGRDCCQTGQFSQDVADGALTGQIDVRNNENMVWNSINLKRVRPVVLPGIRYAVMCVPTPLTLAVDKFSVMDKQAGYYMGKLSVIFTPSLPTIN